MDNNPFGTEVGHVDGKPHPQGMHSAAGSDPKSMAIAKVAGVLADQASQARPMPVRDRQAGSHILAAGAVEGIAT
jgi:hypothetical protein